MEKNKQENTDLKSSTLVNATYNQTRGRAGSDVCMGEGVRA